MPCDPSTTNVIFLSGVVFGCALSLYKRRRATLSDSTSKVTYDLGAGNLDIIRLVHPSGSKVTVYKHGGTITSWKVADGREMLLLSREAVFNGKKAIRGGIPLVFPQFGPGKLANHGFARTSKWDVHDLKGDVLTLVLEDNAETRKIWGGNQFQLLYEIELTATSLRTKFVVTNKGNKPFDFQALLHTYYKLPDISAIEVNDFNRVAYLDKLKGAEEFVENSKDFKFTEEVDRIYKNAPSSVKIRIENENDVTVQVSSSLSDGKDSNHDIVLWNPHIAKSKRMSDFGDDEWKTMVCVEPGVVAGWTKLDAGKSLWLEQKILSE